MGGYVGWEVSGHGWVGAGWVRVWLCACGARVFRAARRVRVVGTQACVDLFAAVTRGRLKPVLPVVRTEFHRIFFRARHEESPETISSTRTRDARPVRPLRRFQTFENGSSVCFQKLQEKR